MIVVIDDEEPTMTTEWLALLASDEPTEIYADAAEVLRDIREHRER